MDEKYNLFDSGCFNHTIKGFILMAMDELEGTCDFCLKQKSRSGIRKGIKKYFEGRHLL